MTQNRDKPWFDHEGGEVKTVALSTYVATVAVLLGALITLGTWAAGVTYERNTLQAELRSIVDEKLRARDEVNTQIHANLSNSIAALSRIVERLQARLDDEDHERRTR